jgi:hypothetical protein
MTLNAALTAWMSWLIAHPTGKTAVAAGQAKLTFGTAR